MLERKRKDYDDLRVRYLPIKLWPILNRHFLRLSCSILSLFTLRNVHYKGKKSKERKT